MNAPPEPRTPLEAGAWLDVTRALRHGHPNWPGDTEFSLHQTAHLASGDSVNVMALHTSTHSGTHLDAPYHYDDAGARLGALPLDDLIGVCLVLDVRDPVADAAGPVPARAALEALERLGERGSCARVLLRTGQEDLWRDFPSGFRPLSEELVDALADRGARLLGTDAPSVDALTSKSLPVHAAFARRGVWIVEGLALAKVTEGRYELCCLPLNMPEADASPVRALLRPLQSVT